MRILFASLLCSLCFCASSQALTVEKIMQDPKWIGTSPSGVFWSADGRALYFQWNPTKAESDSAYRYVLNGKEPQKVSYREAKQAQAVSEGTFNVSRSKVVYSFSNDVFVLDIPTGKTQRITQTEAVESEPRFVNNGADVVYQKDNNLFVFYSQTGLTRQLTAFTAGNKKEDKKLSESDQWLQREALRMSDILQKRENKKNETKSYLDKIKDADTLPLIYTGDKEAVSQQASPDTRFVSYQLYKAGADKKTVVPAYVTNSGYTTDIPSRSKVGAPQGKYEMFVFDRKKDTVIQLYADSLPGINNEPAYLKEYPQQKKDSAAKREVYITDWVWNDEGSTAVADIRSLDFKDRWLVQFDTATVSLRLISHQHDDAWIGGPGIGWLGSASLGFINNQTIYFFSEATGYSHLYRHNLSTGQQTALTQGSYEVRNATLSKDKQFFYLLTNEEHPGKQSFYRIRTDGSGKEKLTSLLGGYNILLSPDEKKIAYRYSYQNKPWELYVQDNGVNKKPLQITYQAASDEWKQYPWRDAKIISFPARDGASVYARVYEPAAGTKNGAAVVFVHGAGYLQNVDYRWSDAYFREAMFNNLLADKGYTVIDVDYRASEGYGRNWRTGIYRHMGGKDLDDEVDAARLLVKEYGIDSARIGMYGGSYGGFMTLMALFTQPSVFKAGAALRPVTDWAHYNHTYTAAILNEPYNDSLAYARSSPINFAQGLENHLLICHGMVDVNVHFEDAVRLAQRLIELGKDNWELAVYPVENHGFVEPSSWTDEYKRILRLFDNTLLKNNGSHFSETL